METIASMERWVEVNSQHMEKLSEFGRSRMKNCLEQLLNHYQSQANEFQSRKLQQKLVEIEAVMVTPLLMQSSVDDSDDPSNGQKQSKNNKKAGKPKPAATPNPESPPEPPKPVVEVPEELRVVAKTIVDAILAIKDDFPEGSVRSSGESAVTFWPAVADEVKLKAGLTPEIEEQLKAVGLLQWRSKKIPSGKIAKYYILKS